MVKYTIVLDVVGLEYDHLDSGLVPNISKIANTGESAKMEPVFPAVTCTVQASILSGKYPNQHGIISNGFYDRNNYTISFWEQSNALVQTDRIWDIIERNDYRHLLQLKRRYYSGKTQCMLNQILSLLLGLFIWIMEW